MNKQEAVSKHRKVMVNFWIKCQM